MAYRIFPNKQSGRLQKFYYDFRGGIYWRGALIREARLL